MLFLLSSVLLIGCNINGVQKEPNKSAIDVKNINVYENIDMDLDRTYSSFVSWATGVEFSDKNKKDSSVIAVVTFESITGGERVKNYEDLYSWIYTKGQMRIESVIKGDINKGDIINYRKVGGITPYDQFISEMSDEQIAKLKSEYKESSLPKYFGFSVMDETPIEFNKTYLVYLDDREYSEDGTVLKQNDYYHIMGSSFGMQEVIEIDGKYQAVDLNNENRNWPF